MPTLDQARAALAYDHVKAFSKRCEGDRTKYATIVHKLPALLTSAGLCQALHFVSSRGDDAQMSLLGHLATQLNRVDPSIGDDPKRLLDVVRKAELPLYLRLTNEAFICAAWYRRMVQGVLNIAPGNGA